MSTTIQTYLGDTTLLPYQLTDVDTRDWTREPRDLDGCTISATSTLMETPYTEDTPSVEVVEDSVGKIGINASKLAVGMWKTTITVTDEDDKISTYPKYDTLAINVLKV